MAASVRKKKEAVESAKHEPASLPRSDNSSSQE